MKKIILVEEFRVDLENGLKRLIDRLMRAASSGSLHIQVECEE
jgi:hypothetical protein